MKRSVTSSCFFLKVKCIRLDNLLIVHCVCLILVQTVLGYLTAFQKKVGQLVVFPGVQ